MYLTEELYGIFESGGDGGSMDYSGERGGFCSGESNLRPRREFRHITTDSRNVAEGEMFFALRGENFDGNRYAAKAIEAGAAAAVVDDSAVIPDSGADREKYFLVTDVLTALQQLAAHHRRKLAIPILAITGSNGKTTTKELVGLVLSQKYRVSATQGNLNNHIGVPLTILAMDGKTEFGIVEMGANHQGEIKLLCRIAQPDYGIITNVGKSHIEGFGGMEGIIKGKGELFDCLESHGGMAFYLDGNDILRGMVEKHEKLLAHPYSLENLTALDNSGLLGVLWKTDGAELTVDTMLTGDYNLYNVAAAISIGRYFGIPAAKIKAAIESYVPDNNRSQKLTTARNELILDAYNANPTSMEMAINNFARMKTSLPKVVILGDMFELGEYAGFEHMQVITLLQSNGFDEVYLSGTNFRDAAERMGAAGKNLKVFGSTEELISFLKENKITSRTILIKGSRGNRLEKVVEFL